MPSLYCRILCAAAGIALAPFWVFAQARLTGADLTGIVTDPQGARVDGCSITATNVETNVARTSKSDESGTYTLPALPPGTYTVTAAIAGFKPLRHQSIELSLGQAVRVNFSLELENTTAAVTVRPEATVMSTGRIEIGMVVKQHQIDSLPINGRNFIGFAALTPGVANDRTPLRGAAATSGLSFTGQQARSNNIMVDGLDNNDPVMGAVRATFSQEAVREFQILVDSYSAEFGKASGGVVNILTKSGTNTLRGSAFAFLRDDTLNARNYFERFDPFGNPLTQGKAPFRQTQWGSTLGGPVRRNRAFYFVSYEATRIRDSRFVSIDTAAADLLDSLGFPVQLGSVPFTVSNTDLLGKIDHQWTTGRWLTVRANHGNTNREALDDYGGIVARTRATVQLRRNWSLSAVATDVLPAGWINESRVQFADDDQRINSLDASCRGSCTNLGEGGPTLEVAGIASVGRHRFTPLIRMNRRIQLADTISYVRRAHHVKLGVDYNNIFFPTDNRLPAQFGGRFVFTAIPALGVTSALDGLQEGIPAAYCTGYGNPYFPAERYHDVSVFAQDEWSRNRLTLRTGVRYQRQFWQDTTFTVSDVGGGTFSYPMPIDRNNLGPRAGLSFDLSGTGRTIAHAAYGMYYDNIIAIAQSPGRVLTGGVHGVRSLVLLAPRASIAWNAPGHRLTEQDALALVGGSYASAVIAPNPSLRNSFTHQASVGLDRILASNLALSVNFIYARGYNLPGTIDYNPVLPSELGPGRRPNDSPCDNYANASCVNGGIPGTSASVLHITSFGETWYRGLALTLNKRLARNSQFLVSYMLSRAEDTSTDFQTTFIVQDNGSGRNPADREGLPLGFDPRLERGASTHDQRHRLVLSGQYVTRWSVQLAGILTAGSGRPFTPLAGVDLNGDGNGGQFPPDRARRDPVDESTSVARNSGTTANQLNLDLRVSRKFTIRNGLAFEAIVDAFNVFNNVNFVEETNQSSFAIFGSGAYPSTPLAAYGRYTLALPPRQVQLAARFTF